MIYLDNNATTRMSASVAEAMSACLAERLANPASSHGLGRAARRRLEDARRCVASHVGARLERYPPDRVVFTSGATEANHLAIQGLAARRPGAVIVSSIEHPSVIGAAEHLRKQGREVRVIAAQPSGVVDLSHLAELLQPPIAVVALMFANNETGVIQPVAEAARMCHDASAPLHCDAVQAIGKLPLDFRELDLDTLSFNAHKIHGPVGVGALLIRGGVELAPLMEGGGQQLGTRPGTESVPNAVGLAKAVDDWTQSAEPRRKRLERQRDRLEQLLGSGRDVIIHGRDAPRVPTTTNISFVGLNRQELLMALDLAGVACSTGSACASGSSEPSPVLMAMGLPDAEIEGSLRLSLGADTTDQEIEDAAARIQKVAARLRGKG